MSEATALSVRGLCKAYPDFKVEDVSFDVPEGMIVGFVGENGAGKTTVINCLLGIVFPSEGSIQLFGEQVASIDSHYIGDSRFAQLRQEVGVVFDTCAFPNDFSLQKVRMTCASAFEKWDDAYFLELLEKFSLDLKKEIQGLSRGMGMKLSLACALAHHPQLLILDEATAGLDPLARDEILDTIRKCVEQDGCSVLMSSHITSDLEKCADILVCIHEGRIVFDMPVADIVDRMGIARCSSSSLKLLQTSNVFGPGDLRATIEAYSTNVLIPDRFAFEEAFPEIPIDRMSIDDYLTFILKGETL